MKTDEKLTYFYDCLTAKARSDGEKMVEAEKTLLRKEGQKHREEKEAQLETDLKKDAFSYQRTLNSSFSEEQLKIRHELADKTQQLTDALFEEVAGRLEAFRRSPAYLPYLCRKIKEVKATLPDQNAIFLLSPSDEHLSQALSEECGITVSIDSHEFRGGFRVLCPQRRLMMDHSFETGLCEEKEAFVIS